MERGGASDPVVQLMARTIVERGLADGETPVVLMVSGGSDSTALTYAAAELARAGAIGPIRILHVNHLLRGEEAFKDVCFVTDLVETLGVVGDFRSVDMRAIAEQEGGNVEAIGRRERYAAAMSALSALCREAAYPVSAGRIFTAHTQNDRVESFYMRSIVGTGPGGFRAMRYMNGQVARPLLDASRADLRTFIQERAAAGLPVVRDESGALWREDATNAHTDRFRAFVRHEIVPRSMERNPRLLDTLCRTMNLAADEDDMLEKMAADIENSCVTWEEEAIAGAAPQLSARISPSFGKHQLPLRRRVVARLLRRMLPSDARIETSSIDAVLGAFDKESFPISGYVTNVQGDIAVSANKRGVLIEPMVAFRSRRKKVQL